eukprot:jgi/Ulvmu1/3757/UM175_0004.1
MDLERLSKPSPVYMYMNMCSRETEVCVQVTVINGGMECILNADDIAAGVVQGPKPATVILKPPTMDPPMTNMTLATMNTTDPNMTLPDCFGICIGNNRRCFGSATRFGSTPAPCCSEDYSCVRRNARFSQCRRNGSSLPRGWDGSIEECNLV